METATNYTVFLFFSVLLTSVAQTVGLIDKWQFHWFNFIHQANEPSRE